MKEKLWAFFSMVPLSRQKEFCCSYRDISNYFHADLRFVIEEHGNFILSLL